ncbi:hypothetical protein SADUNF_Sadunf02G0078300 [Salix dunnii]|uniref:Uncharacterized protein n=1 Tax=Salix dunnii TaxID=1413687 RepID=A0A835N6K6_9ROSI|nr:hypothetical protein SADUNF_Sadunf02G0078300 [Salix dunnii]
MGLLKTGKDKGYKKLTLKVDSGHPVKGGRHRNQIVTRDLAKVGTKLPIAHGMPEWSSII